jgi:alpha-D-ribose 1-methylphosphonate 5-triphosphate diphosphatase
VLIGSHDDHTAEDRVRGRALGATVSEFPETRGGGGGGARGGEGVIMGAPNLVRGGSHAGKVAAGDLVAAGLVDALASDYHYPAPARAAFRLERDGMDLPGPGRWCRRGPRGFWAFGPGAAGPGSGPIMVVVEEDSRGSSATIAGGAMSYMAGPVADRFLGAAA